MKRPDRNCLGLLTALLLALGAAGCGGLNATVPISPMMFIHNSSPPPAAVAHPGPELAATEVTVPGQ